MKSPVDQFAVRLGEDHGGSIEELSGAVRRTLDLNMDETRHSWTSAFRGQPRVGRRSRAERMPPTEWQRRAARSLGSTMVTVRWHPRNVG